MSGTPLHEKLRAVVDDLAAPHDDHTGILCFGGRSDCCWQCAVLEGLVLGVRECNAVHEDLRPIALPRWTVTVKS